MADTNLELINNIRAAKIFSALSMDAISSVLDKSEVIYLHSGEILFNQGDFSDSVYLVIKGKLSAILIRNESKAVAGMLEAGEVFGELGVLSEQPRSLTVQAFESSEVLRIPGEVFKDLFHNNASVCVATSYPIIRRAIDNVNFAKEEGRVERIVILPADVNLPLNIVYQKIYTLVQNYNHVLLVHENHFADMAVSEARQKIVQQQANKKLVIYFLNSFDSDFAKMSIDNAEIIYFLVNKHTNEDFYELTIKMIWWRKQHANFRRELIVLEENNNTELIRPFIKLSDFSLYHKVKLHEIDTFKRLVRFMVGQATGLVLSGGGTKGWGHVGAIRALRELKIPIDIIGGTSIGSIIGALYAMNLDCDAIDEKFTAVIQASRNILSWRNMVLPLMSFYSGKGFTKILHKIFDIDIQNLSLPFFCTSCNISSLDVAVHQYGKLAEKLRASASIPGLIPPALINGELHMDGSVLKHLPVDSMRNLLRNSGKTIAILISIPRVDPVKYNAPPIYTFTQALLHKIGTSKTKFVFPPLRESFFRTIVFGGTYACASNISLADILVEVDFSEFPLLEINEEHKKLLLAAGYEKTRTIVSNSYSM